MIGPGCIAISEKERNEIKASLARIKEGISFTIFSGEERLICGLK